MGIASDTYNAWQGLGAAAGGMLFASEITDRGQGYASEMGTLAANLQDQAGFKGYGVKTGLGQSNFAADGSLNVGVGPNTAMGLQGQGAYGAGLSNMGAAGNLMAGSSTNPYAQQAMRGMDRADSLMTGNSTNPYAAQAQSGMNAARALVSGSTTNPYAQQAMRGMGAAGQGVAGMQSGAFDAQNQFMNQSRQSTAGREQDIYNRAMAMQQPMLDQQRAQQQAREYAQGRGGIRGSQFGGTGEDAAMAKAQAMASNAASFQAMQQGQQEMMNQANMANIYGSQGMAGANFQQGNAMGLNQMGMQNAQLGQAGGQTLAGIGAQQGQLGLQGAQLGQSAGQNLASLGTQRGQLGLQNAQLAQAAGQGLAGIGAQQGQMGMMGYQNQYLPMQQQLNALQVGAQGANMAQTGQLTGTGYSAQLGLGGIQTAVNADKAASEMYGNIVASMMNNANGENGSSSWLGSLLPF